MKKEKRDYKVNSIREIFEGEKPLARLVHSSSGYYFYDTGTNKILECKGEVFDLVQRLLTHTDINQAIYEFSAQFGEKIFQNAADEIIEAVNREKVLLVKKASKFGLSDHDKDIEGLLKDFVQSITLEVTQECNLRCLYCIYNDHVRLKRNYSQKNMSLEVAKKAIQYLKVHSSKIDLVGIGFYGGEPLLRFPFIQRCVEYTRQIFADRGVLFNITTNATLITPKIAEYLLENGFSILVSLDGPEIFHDRYRKDKTGNGSYQKTIKGLKILSTKYKEIKKGQISINLVYTPPFSAQKLENICEFLDDLYWLPLTNVTAVYPSEGTIPANLISGEDLNQDKNLIQWAFEKYMANYRESTPIVKGIIEQRFAKLMQRPVFSEPVDRSFFNGCCVPGQRKNFITAEGMIKVCEKISSQSPEIGNVFNGHDINRIQKAYIEDYAENSIEDCSKCWGSKLCDVCYIAAFNESGGLDLERKRNQCLTSLKSIERLLGCFVDFMKANPGDYGHLFQYDLT